jgi:hypothetical protein
MERIEKSIEVECPLRTVYNQWTQFEEFPRFMKEVKKVTQLDDQRLHWEAEIGGEKKEWDARITDQSPDQLIAWQSEGGDYTSGIVSFAALDPGRTSVTLQLLYDPKGFEVSQETSEIVSRRVENDLKSFKAFIEHRGQETGAWRGPGLVSPTRTAAGTFSRRRVDRSDAAHTRVDGRNVQVPPRVDGGISKGDDRPRPADDLDYRLSGVSLYAAAAATIG